MLTHRWRSVGGSLCDEQSGPREHLGPGSPRPDSSRLSAEDLTFNRQVAHEERSFDREIAREERPADSPAGEWPQFHSDFSPGRAARTLAVIARGSSWLAPPESLQWLWEPDEDGPAMVTRRIRGLRERISSAI